MIFWPSVAAIVFSLIGLVFCAATIYCLCSQSESNADQSNTVVKP